MISFAEWKAARAAIKQLHAPGLRKMARNPAFVRTVAETVKAMEAANVDANKVMAALGVMAF